MMLKKVKDIIQAKFIRQWKEVSSTNPLVAAGFLMQDKRFKKALKKYLPLTSTEDLGRGFLVNQSINEEVYIRLSQRWSEAFRDLYTALGRAENAGDINDAFNKFQKIITGEDDSIGRPCPQCDDGEIDGEICTNCNGVGWVP